MKYYKIVDDRGTLVHYSSQYYDPVKAHEYYEQHKKLKGRSTSGLNEIGKQAADYVKSEINKERDSKISTEYSKYAKEVSNYVNEANSLVKSLREKLSKMNKAQLRIFGPRIREQLLKIQRENESKRSELLSKYNAQKQRLTTEAENKYQNELSNISSDSSMVKQKTSSKKSSSSSTKKKTKKKTKKNSNKRTPEDIKDLIQKGKEKYGW